MPVQEIGPQVAELEQWIVREERETVRVRAAAERWIALGEAGLELAPEVVALEQWIVPEVMAPVIVPAAVGQVPGRQLDRQVVGVANGSVVTARQWAVAEAEHLAVVVVETSLEPAATEEAIAWAAADSVVVAAAEEDTGAAGDAEGKRSVDEE
jgi:hypothetical protein